LAGLVGACRILSSKALGRDEMSKNRRIKSSSNAAARESRGRNAPQSSQAAHGGARGREVGGILALGVSLFLVLALISLQGGGLLMGPFGSAVAGVVYGIAGLCSYALVILVLVASVRVLMERRPALPAELAVGVVLGVIALSTLLHLAAPDYRVASHGPGGVIGEHIAEILRALISTAGTALLATVGLVVAVVVATPLRMRQVLGWLGAGGDAIWESMAAAAAAVGRFVGDVFRAILPERDRDEYEPAYDDDEDPLELEPAAVARIKDPPIFERSGAVPTAALDGDTERVDEADAAHRVSELEAASKRRKKKTASTTEIDMAPVPAPATVANDEAAPPKKPRKATAADAAPAAAAVALAVAEPAAAAPALSVVAPVADARAGAPMIVESRFKHADEKTMAEREKQLDSERKGFVKIGDGAYQLPPIHLLAYDAGGQNAVDKSAMLELSARLTQTLENYGVKGDVVAIRPGPVVTMYEFAPAPGTRVNKIVNLTDDLAMALEALRVRIVAPIPGKAAVGIEVPNRTREKVFLKEILADDVFRKSKSRLAMALGKDIEGAPYVVDLARMPHLLVAGTTGSGKSVAVNTMITSLLYNSTPEEVRMIMVDPKMLELSIYEGIPHLLLPVVTDPRKANLALRWAVDEMDRRYDMLAQMGVRDISTFNEKAAKLRVKWEADKLRIAADAAERAAGGGDDDDVDITSERGPEAVGNEPPNKLPYIVVVIDEFADLMMCAPKEVEISVARIAQKARAAGIHLVLATQRPSVDVITGLIKANFPSRMAFHVTSKVDSRTILDQGGAEALLGAGDMLFSDRGAAPMRLHGCYVDEEEIHKVVAFLKTQGRPVYNLDILKPRDEEGEEGGFAAESGGGGGKVDDEMYDKAVHIVTTTRNASISWVQRQLRIGYNRAARLVEEMEKQGVVSPPDHTNKREVMVSAA
jgi:S-DNA-T family DNA segregation ATPase FtsK/SpoIIIE